MSIIMPEIEIVDRTAHSIRYLEHGWPTDLCRWHNHVECELHLVTATRGKVFIGDHIGVFEAGSLYLTGSLLPHNWVTDEALFKPVPVRDMLIQFSPAAVSAAAAGYPEFRELNRMLKMAGNGIEFLGYDPSDAARRLAQIRDAAGLKRVLLSLDFLYALSRWPDKKTLSVAGIANDSTRKKHAEMAKVIEYVVANYAAKDLAASRFARQSKMSESAFSRCFQGTTGNRFTEFVNRVRIGHACIRLLETSQSVAQIGYGVGFQSLANFNRHFSKFTGKTPRSYRSAGYAQAAPPPGPVH